MSPPSTALFRPDKLKTAATFSGTILAAWLATTAAAEAKPYKGAEVYSRNTYLYGRIEMRMRMIKGGGLLSTFFTYKNGSEIAGAFWEEIDIEVLGKDNAMTWQSNIVSGQPRETSEQIHRAASSLADDYHTYTLEWTPNYVSWALDGVQVRKTEGGQVSQLTSPESFRFNVWSSENVGWVGEFDEASLPAYQFVNWIKYYRYDNGNFVLDWTDNFDTFDNNRWLRGTWTFESNRVDFQPANAVVQDGVLVLAITKEGTAGFSGTVPRDPQDDNADGPSDATPTSASEGSNSSGCSVATSQGGPRGTWTAVLSLGLAFGLRRASRPRRPRGRC